MDGHFNSRAEVRRLLTAPAAEARRAATPRLVVPTIPTTCNSATCSCRHSLSAARPIPGERGSAPNNENNNDNNNSNITTTTNNNNNNNNNNDSNSNNNRNSNNSSSSNNDGNNV